MPKLRQSMIVTSSDVPYMVHVATPWAPGLPEEFKHYPGAAWNPQKKVWRFPSELLKTLEKIAVKYQLEFRESLGFECKVIEPAYDKALRDYQKKTVLAALITQKWMINFEMRLGKTLTAIEALKLSKKLPALIVCPASVRLVWRDELKKWWAGHPEVQVIETGKDVPGAPIVIVSYELFAKLALSTEHSFFSPCQAFIFDESHYLKNGKVSRSEAAKAVLSACPSALVMALTGTPICNEPMDLWNQLNLLWPGRFGSFFNFCKAYCKSKENDYSDSHLEFYGLNEERAAELEMRLASCSSRVTKSEVSHLLPPFELRLVPVQAKKTTNFKKMFKELKMRAHENQLENWCKEAGEEKFPIVAGFVEEAIANGIERIAVLTHYRDSVESIAELVRGSGYVVVCLTGDIPSAKRHQMIEEAKLHPRSILISTMHAIAEGLELTRWSYAIFAELYWQPKTMVQAAARFHSPNSQEPVQVDVLVLEGTHEELIAASLKRKLGDSKQLLKQTVVEASLDVEFNKEMTEEQFLADLKLAAASKFEEDEYV